MKMKKIKIATVFSGIGAIEQALLKNHIPYDIVFACDNGEREIEESYESIIDYSNKNKLSNAKLNEYVKELYLKTGKKNYMKQSYFANYKISESKWYEDIRFIDGKKYENKVDLFVGGSPCQSFSIVGDRLGLADARGTLFYEYTRLIKEIQPKVFIYENVRNLQNHNNGNTWKVIKNSFEELNYKIYPAILNASNYGIPQTRRRMFVVGFRNYDGTI